MDFSDGILVYTSRRRKTALVLAFSFLVFSNGLWAQAGSGATSKPEQSTASVTRGFVYDPIKHDFIEASVDTYRSSIPLGVDARNCRTYKDKVASKNSDDVTGIFLIDIGSDPIFTISFCKTGYESRTFADQDSKANQPWLQKREVALLSIGGDPEPKSTFIETELRSLFDDMIYYKRAAPEAFKRALDRIRETAPAERKELIEGLAKLFASAGQ